MKPRLITKKITSQIEELTGFIEQDIAEFNITNADNERLKNIKSMIDSLHKISHTLLQLKKLDATEGFEEEKLLEEDAKILAEYIKKRQLANKNE